jgi:hypothetical protein
MTFAGAGRTQTHFGGSSTSRRGRVSAGLLDKSLQTWVVDDNLHRPNHGDDIAGRTPLQVTAS